MRKENEVSYLCPECFKDTGIKIKKWPEIVFNKMDDLDISKSTVENIDTVTDGWVEIYGKCSCGYEGEFIDIDNEFVDIIQYLNNNGYRTTVCCSGHKIDTNNYDYPYLIFICDWDDRTYLEMINKLPESWEIFKTTLSKPLHYTYNSEVRLYCRDLLKYKETYMDDLKEYIYEYFPKMN